MACSLVYQCQKVSRASIHSHCQTYRGAKIKLVSNIKHIPHFPWAYTTFFFFLKVKLHVTSHTAHIMQFIHESRSNKIKRAQISWTFLTTKHKMHWGMLTTQVSIFLFFLHVYILVMSLDKNTGFLRFRLPVLLQQNLRCKVWDDTAKIRYIYIVHCLPSVNNAVKKMFGFFFLTFKLTAFNNSAHSRKCQKSILG